MTTTPPCSRADANAASVAAASPASQSKMWLSVLPSLSLANHGRVGVERLLGVDDRRQHLVLDVDQLERVTCRVTVVGDDERHLLTVEAHLVGGEHGLRVVRHRRHPRQAERVEHGAGDHGVHLGMSFRPRRVDRDDLGVGVRAAQQRAVQHRGQRDVVDEVAVPTEEAHVLLAEHAAEADRVAGGAGGYGGVGHAVAPRSV